MQSHDPLLKKSLNHFDWYFRFCLHCDRRSERLSLDHILFLLRLGDTSELSVFVPKGPSN